MAIINGINFLTTQGIRLPGNLLKTNRVVPSFVWDCVTFALLLLLHRRLLSVLNCCNYREERNGANFKPISV